MCSQFLGSTTLVFAIWWSAAGTCHPLETAPINPTTTFAGLSADPETRHIDETIQEDTVIQDLLLSHPIVPALDVSVARAYHRFALARGADLLLG